jgi:selenium metabolism protein YedF
VLLCKKHIEQNASATFFVLVDNEAARQNVTRFLSTQGYDAQAQDLGGGVWRLTAAKDPNKQTDASAPDPASYACDIPAQGTEKIVVLLPGDVIGQGDDALGAKLMVNFLATLPELRDSLWRIVLLNAGVKLAVQGSPVLEKLQALANEGVSILVCGTCLDHFGLLNKKAVGETTNMMDVVTSLQLATKVIRP